MNVRVKFVSPKIIKSTSISKKETFKSLCFEQINIYEVNGFVTGGNSSDMHRMLESNPNVLQAN